MDSHNILTALIKSQLPRLQAWEIEGLAKRLEEAENDDGEPIHQVGWLDPKDPTRIRGTTHYMIRELGNPENWIPLYAPTRQGGTQ